MGSINRLAALRSAVCSGNACTWSGGMHHYGHTRVLGPARNGLTMALIRLPWPRADGRRQYGTFGCYNK